DPDHLPGDDVSLLERHEGGVVIGDLLPVDFEEQPVRAFDDFRAGELGIRGIDGGHGHKRRQGSETSAGAPPAYHPWFMPVRATKRGAERTPLTGSWDVLICGASFGGLAVARELAGSGARVMML